ncbi:MAG: hypothetical protein AAGG51_29415, partial [Cyanobacteria bacterium P01_G01_bin.54]
GVTSSLAIENAIQEALDNERHVFIVGAGAQIKRRLQKLGIWQAIPPQHLLMDREAALAQALDLLDLPTNAGVGSPARCPIFVAVADLSTCADDEYMTLVVEGLLNGVLDRQ